jgi:hypothetical protein
VCEIDADGYAAFLVLADMINGGSRLLVVDALKLDAEPANVQDELLFLCFVVAAASFFFVRGPVVLDGAPAVYRLTHPPQAVRMAFLISFAVLWCTQFRPGLEAAVAESRFQAIMDSVAAATWGIEDLADWGAQVKLLSSECGTEYRDEIGRRLSVLPNTRFNSVRISPPPLSVWLTLLPAPDDPALCSPDYQRGLTEFAESLKAHNVEVSSQVALREAVGSAVPYLGDFGVKLAVAIGPALCAEVGAWLHARYGRKVRLKISEKEIEVDAQTIGQVEELLRLAEEFRERTLPKVIL